MVRLVSISTAVIVIFVIVVMARAQVSTDTAQEPPHLAIGRLMHPGFDEIYRSLICHLRTSCACAAAIISFAIALGVILPAIYLSAGLVCEAQRCMACSRPVRKHQLRLRQSLADTNSFGCADYRVTGAAGHPPCGSDR